MLDKKKFYINGQWVSPIKPKNYDVINPSTEEVCAVISLGSTDDTNLAVSAAKNDGVFTPNMLMQGIKASDLTKRKINVAKGQAPLQDLAVAGQRTIGETLPESGTASRLLASGGLLGYGIGIDPFVATTVPLVQRGLYSDLGQTFLNRIMRNSNLLSLATPSVGGQSNVEEGLLGQTVPLY